MTSAPESLEIRTRDGRGLGADLLEPDEARGATLGTAIFAHPMFANRSVYNRPRGRGVARMFHDAGWRTLTFDFRGHGESTYLGKRASPLEQPWSYDELVQVDLPTVVSAARARWPEGRLVVVGHSLGGHVALASQGAGFMQADALVVAGANVWMRDLEPSRRTWLTKLGTITAMAALARRHGSFPVRALRLGTDDEALPYMDDLARFGRQGAWTSRDGSVDYGVSLAKVVVPTFSLTSAGDRLYCRPESAGRMLTPLPRCTQHCVTHDDMGGPPPGHMGLVTAPRARQGWLRAVEWLSQGR